MVEEGHNLFFDFCQHGRISRNHELVDGSGNGSRKVIHLYNGDVIDIGFFLQILVILNAGYIRERSKSTVKPIETSAPKAIGVMFI